MDTATPSTQSSTGILWHDVVDRLDGLRRSLLWVALALLVGTAVSWGVADQVFNFLARPLTVALADAGRDPRLVFTSLTDPFVIYFSVSLLGGLLLGLPVLMTIFWRLIAPLGISRGLYKATAFVACSTALFVAGLAFAQFVLMPFVVNYLLGVAREFNFAITIREYLRLSVRMLLAMGISAQLPLISLVLARFGLVTARQLLRWFPYAVLVFFVLAALITPPDGISQVLVAVPMLALYLLGVVVAALASRGR